MRVLGVSTFERGYINHKTELSFSFHSGRTRINRPERSSSETLQRELIDRPAPASVASR